MAFDGTYLIISNDKGKLSQLDFKTGAIKELYDFQAKNAHNKIEYVGKLIMLPSKHELICLVEFEKEFKAHAYDTNRPAYVYLLDLEKQTHHQLFDIGGHLSYISGARDITVQGNYVFGISSASSSDHHIKIYDLSNKEIKRFFIGDLFICTSSKLVVSEHVIAVTGRDDHDGKDPDEMIIFYDYEGKEIWMWD